MLTIILRTTLKHRDENDYTAGYIMHIPYIFTAPVEYTGFFLDL